MDLIVGRLQAHPSGFGFVVPERTGESETGDIYIDAADHTTQGAWLDAGDAQRWVLAQLAKQGVVMRAA